MQNAFTQTAGKPIAMAMWQTKSKLKHVIYQLQELAIFVLAKNFGESSVRQDKNALMHDHSTKEMNNNHV